MLRRLVSKFVSLFRQVRVFRREDSQREKAGSSPGSGQFIKAKTKKVKETADERKKREGDRKEKELQQWKDRAAKWKVKTYDAKKFGHPTGETEPDRAFLPNHVILYTDGSHSTTWQHSGIGTYYGEGHPLELSLYIGRQASPFVAELFAITIALYRLYHWRGYNGDPIVLRTDCLNCIIALNNRARKEDVELQKYVLTDNDLKNLEFLESIIANFPAEVVLQYVQSHPSYGGHPGNDRADALALAGRKLNPEYKSLQVSAEKHSSPEKKPIDLFRSDYHQFTKDASSVNPSSRPKIVLNSGRCTIEKFLNEQKEKEEKEYGSSDELKNKLGLEFLADIE